MSKKNTCQNCKKEYHWLDGNPQDLTRVEKMLCVKHDLPFDIMKKVTCPYCGTQALAPIPKDK